MKRRKRACSSQDNKSLKIINTDLFLALIILALLCGAAAAQNTADGWYKKGQELNRNGSFGEAVKAYDRAIELEPNNAELFIAKSLSLNMLALLASNKSINNESMKALDGAIKLDPKNSRAWELKGSFLSQAKKYDESMKAYEKAIENINNYKEDNNSNLTEFLSYIWTSKSISLWQMMKYNESLEALDKAVQIDPAGNYDAWVFKGQLLASLRRFNESLQAFDKAAATEAAKSQPEIKALPWTAKGYVLIDMGRYEEADQIYQRVISLNFTIEDNNRHLADAWSGRGNALAKLGKYSQSLSAFNKSIELNGDIAPYALTGKGDALLASGRYDEAIRAYNQALELYPEHADSGIAHAQRGWGDSFAFLGKSNEALAAYSAAIKASDRAISAFNNATPLDRAISLTFDPYPLDGEFWHDRAFALHAVGREEEAMDSSAKSTQMGYIPRRVEIVAGSGQFATAVTENESEVDGLGR